jgi:hypothetical protein
VRAEGSSRRKRDMRRADLLTARARGWANRGCPPIRALLGVQQPLID